MHVGRLSPTDVQGVMLTCDVFGNEPRIVRKAAALRKPLRVAGTVLQPLCHSRAAEVWQSCAARLLQLPPVALCMLFATEQRAHVCPSSGHNPCICCCCKPWQHPWMATLLLLQSLTGCAISTVTSIQQALMAERQCSSTPWLEQ